MSQPARAVWIEMDFSIVLNVLFLVSQPARAVWIEIKFIWSSSSFTNVTACEGCVD